MRRLTGAFLIALAAGTAWVPSLLPDRPMPGPVGDRARTSLSGRPRAQQAARAALAAFSTPKTPWPLSPSRRPVCPEPASATAPATAAIAALLGPPCAGIPLLVPPCPSLWEAGASSVAGNLHIAEHPAGLPNDPFQRAAIKALRGDFGPLPQWKRAAYRRGLRLGLRAEWPIIATAYWRDEGRSGQIDCRGRPLGSHAAASNIIPQGWMVWLPQAGLRRICDRGAHSNDVVAARRRGIWVDIWFETPAAARAARIDGWVRTRAAVIPPQGAE